MVFNTEIQKNKKRIEAVIADIVARKIDITCSIIPGQRDYPVWLKIDYAMVSMEKDFGFDCCHDWFQKVSQFYPRYTYEETKEQYMKCSKYGSRSITIGSFLYEAKEHGANVPEEYANIENIEEEKNITQSDTEGIHEDTEGKTEPSAQCSVNEENIITQSDSDKAQRDTDGMDNGQLNIEKEKEEPNNKRNDTPGAKKTIKILKLI